MSRAVNKLKGRLRSAVATNHRLGRELAYARELVAGWQVVAVTIVMPDGSIVRIPACTVEGSRRQRRTISGHIKINALGTIPGTI